MNNFKFDVPVGRFSDFSYVSYSIAGSDRDGSTVWLNRIYPVHNETITLTPIPGLPDRITMIHEEGIR